MAASPKIAALEQPPSSPQETEDRNPRSSSLNDDTGNANADFAPAGGDAEIVDRPLRILLADDSPDNRLLVHNYLRNTRYRIDDAENGRVAVEKFAAFDYDVVLMDIQMPEMDGYEATRTIRRWEREHQRPRTPILAVTAAALGENKRRTFEAGCDRHITKPVKRATLLHAIREASS